MFNFVKSRNFVLLLLLAVVFFGVYSWFFQSTNHVLSEENQQNIIFNWPDAMANHFFIEQYYYNNTFSYDEPLNEALGGIIKPRSVNVLPSGELVPTGFLGFVIISGWLAKIVGLYFVNFLTPLLSVITVLFFYALIKEVFDEKTGFISAILLFTFAGYWYYSSLVMLSTVFFISLFVIGLYFLIFTAHNNDTFSAFLSGLFMGLAIITRSSEIIWISLIAFLYLFIVAKESRLKKIMLFILGLSGPAIVILYYNNKTFGNPLSVGYLNTDDSASIFERLPGEITTAASNKFSSWFKLLFIPFGFFEKNIIANFYRYIVQFMGPYLVLALVGGFWWLIEFIKNKKESRIFFFFVATMITSMWLVFYYGSWEFIDKVVLKNNLIGSSYIRYWMPIYMLALPFVAYLLNKITKLKANKLLTFSLVSLLISGLFLFSFNLVYQSKGDGLLDQHQIISSYYKRAEKFDEYIQENDLIIINRVDKLLFPKHKVVNFNLDYSIFAELRKVLSEKRVIYFTLMPDSDIEFINSKQISSLKLKLANKTQVDEEYFLYELVDTAGDN
jgi:hypothetical protein